MVVAWDTETERFRAGCMAPPLVCISYQRPGFDPNIVHAGGLDDRAALELVESWLKGGETLVTHHGVYDYAVICAKWPHLVPLVFQKYDRDEITDTKLRQQLLDIAAGCFRGHLQHFSKEVKKEDGTTEIVQGARWHVYNYALDDLAYRALGRRLDKAPKKKNADGTMPEDTSWQKRYVELKGIPISQWPPEAVQYPLDDARATLEIFEKQEVHKEYLKDQFRQARAAWALHLTSVWGLKTHAPGVEKLEKETISALAEIEGGLKEIGLVRKDGSRDMKKAQARMVAVCKAAGKPIRLTETGEKKFKEITATGQLVLKKRIIQATPETVYETIASVGGISLDADACEACEDPVLEDYAELTSLKAVLNKDIPILRAGIVYPVHTSFGMAASIRVTSSRPNVQNPRRLPGIREAFIPRPGKVFAQADFSGLELHTLAQVCITLFGYSKMAEVLNSGMDAHTDFAASLLGISYEEASRRKDDADDDEFQDARQSAKVANFGFGGGMGAETFVAHARHQGVKLTLERAKELKAIWLVKWPETSDFFKHVSDLCDQGGGEAVVEQLFDQRWRGGCTYCAAANTYFQGLGASAAKRATYIVSRACYAEPESVMYGSRIVNMVHDELIVETDDVPAAHEVAVELGHLMRLGADQVLPNVPSRIEPLLARCWSKKAKPRFVDGRLVPWSPT